MSESLPMWVIYDHPIDHPDWFVVRRWDVKGGERAVPSIAYQLFDTIEQAREGLPPGVTCIGRYDEDDPKIVEVWI